MNLAITIAKRIAFNRQPSFSKFIIRLSAGATALSVAAMIITLAFVNGFQTTVANKVFSFWGHIRVQHYQGLKSVLTEETPILKNDTVINAIMQQAGVQHVHAFGTKSAVIEKNKEIEGILFKGIEANYDSAQLQQFIIKGSWINFNDSVYSHEILLPEYLANTLQLTIGDTLRIYFVSNDKTIAAAPRKLKLAGIFKTGIEEYDKLFAIGDLRLIRRLNNWQPTQIGGYEVFLKDYQNIDTVNTAITEALPYDWNSRTIREVYPNIFDWLNIMNTNRNVVFIIMAIVAIINLITCLLILVLERSRMAGILKALGTSDWTIQQIFLYYAATIAFTGIGIGFIVGIGLCICQQYTHFIHMDEASYYIAYAPIDIVWWQVAAVCIATAIICFIALLLPTFIIKKIQPVKVIQFK